MGISPVAKYLFWNCALREADLKCTISCGAFSESFGQAVSHGRAKTFAD